MSDERELIAERQLRRGNLREALALFEELSAAAPLDVRLRQRAETVRGMLQPSELTNAKAASPAAALPEPSAASPVAQAEACADRGDWARAIALYEQAVRERPEAALLRERLAEIRGLAGDLAPRSATQALPQDRRAMLEALLERVSAQRRKP
jgi:tetratricopeptide (TPR) repeat protein